MQSEAEFLKIIEKKAGEEKRILDTELMPSWAKGIGEWLVVNPWRVIGPITVMIYIGLRLSAGEQVREFFLDLFGGYK